MNILELDHIALQVVDVEKSRDFYVKALQLQELPRPNFSFPGVWFALGPHELHLIGDRDKEVNSHHRGTHFAIRVSDVEPCATRLDSLGIEYIRKHRPDGAHQIFFQDPDGHYVEFCQPPAANA